MLQAAEGWFGVAAGAAADLEAADRAPGSRAAVAIRLVDRVGVAEAERQLDGLQPDRGQRGEPLGKMRFRQYPAAIVRQAAAAHPDDRLRGAQLALDLLTKSEPVIEPDTVAVQLKDA